VTSAPSAFNQWLKRQRRARDLTQEELADRVGCALVTLRKIEAGERRPSKEIAGRLADALAIPDSERERFVAFARAVYPDEIAESAPEIAVDASFLPPGARPGPPDPHHNLPAQLTSFIGREREIAEVRRLLTGSRLLTLTGAGGCGKTRLALEVAGRLAEDAATRFADGIWLVDLARLEDPRFIPQSIVSALGLRDEGQRPLPDVLAGYLRPRRMLLLLDNCEHLIGECAGIADMLLRAAPGLAILATSREPLAVDGETVFHVPSLQLPDPQHLPRPEELVRYEAIRLFQERASAARPGFEITAETAGAVAEVCQRLDGLPLAIELAASRARVLPVRDICARLADRFRLLTGGSRAALPRHQTLRATIEWSITLLSEPERTLLRQLAVFAGGWTLEAANAVCVGGEVEGADAGTGEDLLDLMTRLVDKSLVVPEWRGRGDRYGMLETLRQFAAEQLEQAGEAAAARGRHAAYFVALAEQAEPLLMSRDQTEWQIRLEVEHNNFQVALDWLETPEASTLVARPSEEGLRLAGALWRYWEVRGHIAEGRSHLDRLLRPTDPDASRAVLARAHLGAGVCAFYGFDYPSAIQHYEDSARLYRLVGDDRGVTRPLTYLGWLYTYQADYARGRGLLEKALQVSRAVGDRQAEAWATARLGVLAYFAGDPAKGAPLLERALALSREMGDALGTGWWLLLLGMAEVSLGRLDRAAGLLEECVVSCRQLGDLRDCAFALAFLGLIAHLRGETEGVPPRLRESLRTGLELDDPVLIFQALFVCAVCLAPSEPVVAVRLIAAITAFSERVGVAAPLDQVVQLRELSAALEAALGSDAFSAGWARGAVLPLPQVAAEALAMDAAPAAS
jgi:non-specific serine/threonine protein kinase